MEKENLRLIGNSQLLIDKASLRAPRRTNNETLVKQPVPFLWENRSLTGIMELSINFLRE